MIPPGPWIVLNDWRVPRLGRRIDAVVLLTRAIVVCTVRPGRPTARDRLAAEDAALDLHDFHAGSQAHPVVPLLVTEVAARRPGHWPLMLPGVTPVMETGAATLGGVLAGIDRAAAFGQTLDRAAWPSAAYRPIPSLIEAARMLYARHGVGDIAAAHADAIGLRETRSAIGAAIARATVDRRPAIVFVTGIPGAGKTLCGLDTAFAGEAAFLTGNPSLVHVLREALVRDSSVSLRAARQRMEGVIQALPKFRDAYAERGVPPERVVVIDEAQRCWSSAHAITKTAARATKLRASEPAVLLDIMARRQDGPVIVCLIGTGQEIHDGEGGLAEWGEALRARPAWRVLCAEAALRGQERHRLPAIPCAIEPALHLCAAVRSLRSPVLPAWVDAVLDGDEGLARSLAEGGIPVAVTRSLTAMRHFLRQAARGTRRAGLLCSSGARRLRAEGLGATLPHDEPGAVARWFLDPATDVRSSGALEVAATEFFCQGLELDYAGVCWDSDLLWAEAWHIQAFRGSAWTRPRAAMKRANKLNAYRVLLTRARYATVIWVPEGDERDDTRCPKALDAVAAFLLRCGAKELADDEVVARAEPCHADLLGFGAGGRSESRDLEPGMADRARGG